MRALLCAFAAMIAISASAAGAAEAPELSKERVIFHTNVGDLVFALYPKVAPKHVARILEMAKSGVFNDAGFYRLEPGFVLQLENFNGRKRPLSANLAATVTKIPGEFSQLKHRRGVLSMARFDDVNSAESSFSILLGDAPHLDGQYTIFGELAGGEDVLAALEATPVNAQHAPVADLIVSKAEVINASALAAYPLQHAKPVALPSDASRNLFLALAGFLFFVTMAVPIAQALAPAPARAGPGRERSAS